MPRTISSSAALLALVAAPIAAAQVDITAPGSVAFGTSVRALPNGNIVVTDPSGPTASIGTVYLYTPSGAPISHFTGSSPNDQVGSGGIVVLTNGNFVVLSPHWTNGAASDAGAVTWVDGASGLSGVVSSANSLVGTSANDQVGFAYAPVFPPYQSAADASIVPLDNGNYVVLSPFWNNAAVSQAGAATLADGTHGVAGAVSATNSIIGSHANDRVGGGGYALVGNSAVVILTPTWSSAIAAGVGAATWLGNAPGIVGAVSASNSLIGLSADDQVGSGVVTLSNGNYVVLSPNWSNGAAGGAGAATWAGGNAATSGVVSPANSLVGTHAGDQVGAGGAFALDNGNYVVCSPAWNAGAGAASWGNGGAGTVGAIAAGNSLIGSAGTDAVCSAGVVALANGNYVVVSPGWSDGVIASVGAVTWGNGSAGVAGAVSAANSLTGSVANDQVGAGGATALSNGNYVVASPYWNDAAATQAGAATWGNGGGGSVGAVGAANSLVGSASDDRVGIGGASALGDGNYVVSSPYWSNAGVATAGAASWGNGASGIAGSVAPANSLVGTQTGDLVGLSVLALANGDYAIGSPSWSNAAAQHAGAVTVGRGASGVAGAVSSANSLVGGSANDFVGNYLRALPNGAFVVASPQWSNAGAGAAQAGAVTWSTSAAPTTGPVSAANSFVGLAAGDRIGSGVQSGHLIRAGVQAPDDTTFVLLSQHWSDGAHADAGALTLASAKFRLRGSVTAANSVSGVQANEGALFPYDYDAAARQLVVGKPLENRVTLLTLDAIFADGFE